MGRWGKAEESYIRTKRGLSYPEEDQIPKAIRSKETVRRARVREITRAVITHCMKQTEESRGFMELNPGLPLPHDYKKYPGKLDHTTCVCFEIGSLPAHSPSTQT